MKFKIIILLLLGGMGCCQSQNQSWNAPEQQQAELIPLDPEIRYGKLDNGFTYYIRKNEQPKNTVELRLIIKAGRIHEDEDQLEYAHLLEHFLTNKTKHYPDIKNHFNKIGGYKAAHTGSRLTSYDARIPSQDHRVVKEGLRIMRDWGQGLIWDPEYIAVQRGAVEGEMRVFNPYQTWVGKATVRELLKNTNYTIYLDEERLANIQNFNPEAFRRYYEDWYRPDLQAAIVVGDINVDSVEHEIKRQFSNMKIPENPKSEMERIRDHTIELDGLNQFSTVIDSVRQELNLRLIHLHPNFEATAKTRKDYKSMLLQQLYRMVLDEKAKQLERQYDPPFLNFLSGYGATHIPDKQLDGSLMSIKLGTGDPQLLKKDFQNGLIAWKQMHLSINPSDLEIAKTGLLKEYTDAKWMKSNSLSHRYIKHFLYGKAAPHPEMEAGLVSEILAGISFEDFMDFISEHGNLDKNTSYFFFNGTKVNMPDHEVFKHWIKETDTMNIKPLVEAISIGTLADVVDIPALNIMDKVEINENEIGVSTVNLQNGVKVVLKPSKPRSGSLVNTIFLQAFRPNRVPVHNRQEYLAARITPQVLQYSGAGTYNKFQLDRFKQEKGIQLDFRTNKNNQMIYARSKMKDLPELFRLLYLTMEEPRKDSKAFAAWKAHQESQLEGKEVRGSDFFFMEKIAASRYPQIPVLEMQDLEKISLEQVLHVWNEWYSSVEDYTFVVTGDFNKDKILPVIVNTLSAFPAKNENISASKPDFDFPFNPMKADLQLKNTDQVYISLFFPVKVSRNIKTQVELDLISKALHQRTHNRLRIGSYSPTARGEWLDIKNGIYAFRIDFDSALGNEEEMVDYALEEFRKLREDGIEKEWLEPTIVNEVRTYESRFDNFGYINFWPDYLQEKLEAGEDPVSGILNYGTLMEHFMNLKDLNAAVKKYMKEDRLQQFYGYPEGYSQ